MAVALTGTGGLFTRLGKHGKVLSKVRTFLRTALPLESGAIEELAAQFDTERKLVTKLLNVSHPNLRSYLVNQFSEDVRQSARETLIEMVNDDTPQPGRDLRLCWEEVIRQMVATSDDVKRAAAALGVA